MDKLPINTDGSKMLLGEGQVLADKMCEFIQHLIDDENEENRIKHVKKHCLAVSDLQGVKEYLLFALSKAYDHLDDENDEVKQKSNAMFDDCMDLLKFCNKCVYDLNIFQLGEQPNINTNDNLSKQGHISERSDLSTCAASQCASE